MRLNPIEKALMNNPVRALIQRRYEAALMERLGGRVEGQRVPEVGCGRGVGTEIIFKRFGAREVHAFDLDAASSNLKGCSSLKKSRATPLGAGSTGGSWSILCRNIGSAKIYLFLSLNGRAF